MTQDQGFAVLEAGGFSLLTVGGFICLIIVVRLAAGNLDDSRVRAYIDARGGRLLSLKWAPFGTGWLGSRDERIYELRYLDGDGREHAATCKTSLFSGVYFTEDHLVASPLPPPVASGSRP